MATKVNNPEAAMRCSVPGVCLMVQLQRVFGFGLSVLTLFLVMTVSWDCRADEQEGTTLAFLGDPQIGYGPGGSYADMRRFDRVVEALNKRRPALVLIAGDLVQDRSFVEHWSFERSLGNLEVPYLLAAGNHDVVDLESLRDFRGRFGPDYYRKSTPEVEIIVVNSETARDSKIDSQEFQSHWAFLERELAQPLGRPVVLLMHRPPFVVDEDERESRANWPPETRRRLLELCRKVDVRLILAGHLHRTHEVRTHDGIEIRVLPGSARSFDRSEIGYEEVIVDDGARKAKFVFVAPAPSPAFRLPYLREWTPRIFEFSPRHWFFSILYLLAAGLWWRVYRSEPRRAWLIMCISLAFFAINMQIDLDELLREVGRVLAKRTGISPIRHVVTGGSLVLLLAWGGLQLTRTFRQGRAGVQLLALSTLFVPTLWFVLSTISHHDIGMLFAGQYWDLLNLVCLGVSAGAAMRVKKATHA